MSDLLDKINHDLTELEEKLLLELRRLRKLHLDERYSPLDEAIKLELSLTRDALAESLEHSGDRQNLSLKTDLHEKLQERMDVMRSLLHRKIPTAFIESAHEEAKRSSESVERTISQSRELAVLELLVRQHHIDGRSIEDIMKERAQFSSRELRSGHVADLAGKGKIAQSPEEIRRKLAERGSTSSGASSFAARDINHTADFKTAAPKGAIAQSPEEIRKKLAERQAAGTTARASFTAKDIEPGYPQDFGGRKEKEKPEPEKPKGKAIFEARDLSKPKP